jgi:hypothetical protein
MRRVVESFTKDASNLASKSDIPTLHADAINRLRSAFPSTAKANDDDAEEGDRPESFGARGTNENRLSPNEWPTLGQAGKVKLTKSDLRQRRGV